MGRILTRSTRISNGRSAGLKGLRFPSFTRVNNSLMRGGCAGKIQPQTQRARKRSDQPLGFLATIGERRTDDEVVLIGRTGEQGAKTCQESGKQSGIAGLRELFEGPGEIVREKQGFQSAV